MTARDLAGVCEYRRRYFDVTGTPSGAQAFWTLGFARSLHPRMAIPLITDGNPGKRHILLSKTIKLVDVYESARYCRRQDPVARRNHRPRLEECSPKKENMV
jgi:hypothetical protein